MYINNIHKKKDGIRLFFCARDRARTCTSLRTLVPETSASTNSATWAFCERKDTTNFICHKKNRKS